MTRNGQGRRRLLLAVGALVISAGCIDRLPDQDRRIVAANPVAKMRIDDLAGEFQQDRKAADRKYFGRALDVSGRVAATHDDAAGSSMSFVDKTGAEVVSAALLDDQAKETIAGLGEDHRITLRCFADHFSGHVVLKSCIRP